MCKTTKPPFNFNTGTIPSKFKYTGQREDKEAMSETANTPASVNGQATNTPAGQQNLNVIQDIKVTLSMELGRTTLSLRELLALNQGSVIELNRLVDEHMDVLVNGTLIAHGEVVVIDDKFGIRLTDVVSPVERVEQL